MPWAAVAAAAANLYAAEAQIAADQRAAAWQRFLAEFVGPPCPESIRQAQRAVQAQQQALAQHAAMWAEQQRAMQNTAGQPRDLSGLVNANVLFGHAMVRREAPKVVIDPAEEEAEVAAALADFDRDMAHARWLNGLGHRNRRGLRFSIAILLRRLTAPLSLTQTP